MGTRYFIFLSFKGTRYHGWQVQPGATTVQKVMDEALSIITGEKISTTGAGRTDSGVHASFFCAHFDSSQNDLAEKKNLIYRLNRFLPSDISVSGIRKVKPEANARYSALSRTYKYVITPKKDPFLLESAWYLPRFLDIVSMNRASSILLSTSDFTSFSRLHSDNKTNLCRVFHAFWSKNNDNLLFTIKADRFLRNMVRAIVGTMADVGRGKTDVSEFSKIIELKDRCAAGTSAPAKGLYLTDIEYPDEIFLHNEGANLVNEYMNNRPGLLPDPGQEIIE